MRLLTPALLLPLAACVVTPEPNGPSKFDRICNADNLGEFVGQPASTSVASAMVKASGAKTMRWVPKNGAVTMDYRPDRLSVALTEDIKVESASCG